MCKWEFLSPTENTTPEVPEKPHQYFYYLTSLHHIIYAYIYGRSKVKWNFKT